ncbi:O-methyltransferase [Nocardioides flavescens]|uniref:SAM-dependent methyltransferase n=1 Tax=Nocardioides flavescens TaxID=2691959 RepID=A0A6L7F236_9ACTN|nr:class I SAM-dependent methyltransferase [Nocardioides flavescens]MXG89284.1 SAM-dependent methyltransferase [Nocardioides flavescens]
MTAAPTTVSSPGAPRPVTPGSILAERLGGLLDRVDSSGSVVDQEWIEDLRSAVELARGLDPYLESVTTPQSPALAELARRTASEDWNGPRGNGVLEQEMLSGHVEGQLLKTLVHLARATRVLEVGLFTGYSALAMAEALPADGRLVALEIDAGVAEFAQACLADSEAGSRVEVRVGPALETLAELDAAGEVFDLVFVDADKGGYTAYLDLVLESGLLAPHGVVVVDNTLMQGLPWTSGQSTANGEAIAAFNAAVAADPRVEQVVVPLRDGLTLIRRADGS